VLTGNPFLKKDIPHQPVPSKIYSIRQDPLELFVEIFNNLRTRGYAFSIGGYITQRLRPLVLYIIIYNLI
jgi:hypothetical protein